MFYCIAKEREAICVHMWLQFSVTPRQKKKKNQVKKLFNGCIWSHDQASSVR